MHVPISLVLIFSCYLIALGSADPVKPGETQPDGSSFEALPYGDENTGTSKMMPALGLFPQCFATNFARLSRTLVLPHESKEHQKRLEFGQTLLTRWELYLCWYLRSVFLALQTTSKIFPIGQLIIFLLSHLARPSMFSSLTTYGSLANYFYLNSNRRLHIMCACVFLALP